MNGNLKCVLGVLLLMFTSCRSLFYKEYRKDYYKLHSGKLDFINYQKFKESVFQPDIYFNKSDNPKAVICTCLNLYKDSFPLDGHIAFSFRLHAVPHIKQVFYVDDKIDAGSIEKIDAINFFAQYDNQKIILNKYIKDTGLSTSCIKWLDEKNEMPKNFIPSRRLKGTDCEEYIRINGVNDFISKFNTNFGDTLGTDWINTTKFIFFTDSNIKSLFTRNEVSFSIELILKSPFKKRLRKIEIKSSEIKFY
jgi:hypothetical protein